VPFSLSCASARARGVGLERSVFPRLFSSRSESSFRACLRVPARVCLCVPARVRACVPARARACVLMRARARVLKRFALLRCSTQTPSNFFFSSERCLSCAFVGLFFNIHTLVSPSFPPSFPLPSFVVVLTRWSSFASRFPMGKVMGTLRWWISSSRLLPFVFHALSHIPPRVSLSLSLSLSLSPTPYAVLNIIMKILRYKYQL